MAVVEEVVWGLVSLEGMYVGIGELTVVGVGCDDSGCVFCLRVLDDLFDFEFDLGLDLVE